MKKIKNSRALYFGLFLGALYKADLWVYESYKRYESGDHGAHCDIEYSRYYKLLESACCGNHCKSIDTHLSTDAHVFAYHIAIVLTFITTIFIGVYVLGLIDSVIKTHID